MTPEQQRIADKILKLLALASSTTFAAEAATAQRLAEELLAQHNVDINKATPGKPSQEALARRTYYPFAKGAHWEGLIVNAICKLCNCTCFFWIETLAEYQLVGTIGNLEAAFYMINEINRQRREAWMEHKKQAGADSFYKFAYGYAKALEDKIDRISNKIKWLEYRAKVLIPWYELVTGHKVRDVSLGMGDASSEAGQDAGRSASLHRGAVGGSNHPKLIGRH